MARLARMRRGKREQAQMTAEEREYYARATPEARAAFEAQHSHLELSLLPDKEQKQLKQEQTLMWATVPEKYRAKAEAMLRGQ